MTHRDVLLQQIRELERKISESKGGRQELKQLKLELHRLRLAEFEEDMREYEDNQQLLKG